PETIVRLAERDNIVGVKEATGSLSRASDILRRCGDRMTLLSGDDFTALPLYAVGARGVISVVSTLMAAEMAGMWDAFAAGDLARARALHQRILPLTELLFAEPSPSPNKAALALLGRMCAEVRLPLV